MNENDSEFPNLIWSCFINWVNTLEKVGDLGATSNQNRDENLVKNTNKHKSTHKSP